MALWRPLLSGALADPTHGDVPVRVELSADRATLRYSLQLDGHWYRKEQALTGTLNRFLAHVLQNHPCPPESTSSPTASDSAPSEASSEAASPSKASPTTTTEPTSAGPSA